MNLENTPELLRRESVARQRRILVAVTVALFLGGVLTLLQDAEKTSILTRGDFPGFYGPALMVWEGFGSRLYDFELQGQIQNRFWPSFQGALYLSVYPPQVAIILSPLAMLSDQLAKWICTVIMACAAFGAFMIVAQERKLSTDTAWLAAVAALYFPPVLVSILATQNTGLSMLILASCAVWARQGSAQAQWKVAVALGLLLYKPQFGMIAIVLFSVLLGWRVLLGAAMAGLFWYFFAVPLLGWEWPYQWLSQGVNFGRINEGLNFHNFVGIESVVRMVGELFGFALSDLRVTGWVSSALLIAGIASIAWKIRIRGGENQRFRAALLIVAVLPLVFPQTLFYDLGISAVAAFGLFAWNGERAFLWLVAGFIAVALMIAARDIIQLPVLSFVSAGIFCGALWTCIKART